MSRMTLALATSLSLSITSCGPRQVIVGIDVASWIPAAQRSGSFGPMPAAPGGMTTGEVPVLDRLAVRALGGLDDVAVVHSVRFEVSATVVDSTGSGADTLRLYVGAPGQDPRQHPAVIEVPVALTPGETTIAEATRHADARVAALLLAGDCTLTLTQSARGPSSGEALNGRFRLDRIRAVLTAASRVGLAGVAP